MAAQKSRLKKIFNSMQKESTDEQNNPDSALFVNNQFPTAYDEYTLPSTASSSNNNSSELCYTLEVPAETLNLPELAINNTSSNNNSSELCYALEVPTETLNLPHDQMLALNNTYPYSIVDEVIIEEVFEPRFQKKSPSLLLQLDQSRYSNNDEVVIDPVSAVDSFDAFSHDVVLSTFSYSNHIQEGTSILETPNAPITDAHKLVDYSDTESEADEPKIKRKKRCQVKKEDWAEEINKKNRENGKQYLGKKKIEGEWKKDIMRPNRIMKPRCSCKKTKGMIQCHLLLEEDRQKIFDKFWSMSWDEKRVYVENLVKTIPTNRQRDRKNPDESKRSCSFVYYLKKGDEPIRVCKTLFLTTLSIGKSCIWGWKTQAKITTNETKTTQPKKTPFQNELQTMQNFLDELPKMPSHYCRKRTSQVYLQPDIESKRQLYNLYKQYCLDNNTNSLSIATFSNALAVQKLSLFKPKKDLCEICNGYKLKNIRKEEYDFHIAKKEEARAEKDSDKEHKDFVFTVDLQAVLMSPRSNVSSHYYKTKLCVHNFCIYDMKSSEGYCFLWNETEGGLNSDEFATIIATFFIETVIPKMGNNNREIILFSDGCCYQNRNTVLANALSNVAMLYNVTIIQKYLEVGHTQMEVDSMHAMIEKKLKNQTINVPAEYITVCQKAKKTKAYHVKYLTHTYFKSFKNLNFYRSIRPGKLKGDPKVTDIRCLKYDPDGQVFYKLRFRDEFALLNQRRKALNKTPFENIPQLHTERRKITKKKYLDLQQLKNTMPEDYRNFYDNLPYEE